MVDRKPDDPAVQLCTGPDGHAPYDPYAYRDSESRPRFRAHLSQYPGVLVLSTQAAIGAPCTRIHGPAKGDNGVALGNVHFSRVDLFTTITVDAPPTGITATALQNGTILTSLRGFDGDIVTPHAAARLFAAWEEVIRGDTPVTRRGGGRRGGITQHPDFIPRVVKLMQDHFSEFDTHLDFITAAKQAGASRSRAYERIKEIRLQPDDFKIAASFGTLADGLRYLTSVQRKRRQQRI